MISSPLGHEGTAVACRAEDEGGLTVVAGVHQFIAFGPGSLEGRQRRRISCGERQGRLS